MSDDTALERAMLRDMRYVLAGWSSEIHISGDVNKRPLRNLAKHVPPPYRGDVYALVRVWRMWPHCQWLISEPVAGSIYACFGSRFELVSFVRYLDSLEKSPIVKCHKCKGWVPIHKAVCDSTFWHYVYYCKSCLVVPRLILH